MRHTKLTSCCHWPTVVAGQLLSLTSCCRWPAVVTDQLLSLTSCCRWPGVVADQLLSVTSCCCWPAVVSDQGLYRNHLWSMVSPRVQEACPPHLPSWAESDVQKALPQCVLSFLLVTAAQPLLVSPSQIRTKDRVFDSISHLIHYHLESGLPIVSAGSELCLQQPVERKHWTGPEPSLCLAPGQGTWAPLLSAYGNGGSCLWLITLSKAPPHKGNFLWGQIS